jgi:N-acetylneuraminic acid mutarotase
MKNQAQIKTAITSLRNNTDNAGQAKRPLYKLPFAPIITTLILSAAAAWAAPQGTWSSTGSMSVGRFVFTATTLQNGKVLVAGGDYGNGVATNTAELYDPASGTFSATGSMHDARVGFSAIRLSNGKVLVEGGASNTVAALASAELYDPATGTWTVTGSMNQGRQQHSAVLLRNGNVLVSGGNIDRTPCADVCVTTIGGSEIYDPSTGQWTSVGEMTIPRSFFTTTLLPNGRVLAVGGRIHTGPGYFDYGAIAFADLYAPATGKWKATRTMTISREDHSSVLLSNGQVLAIGGTTVNFNGITVASTELYDPATDAWTATGSMLQDRERHTATVLQSGQVLVAGGDYYDGVNAGFLTECELYDPAVGTWSVTASMSTPRYGARAALLRDGRVLEAGGDTDFSGIPTASAELYTP